MSWATIREAVRQAVVDASGLTDVVWMNRAQGGVYRKDPHIDLVLRQVSAVGVDETRTAYDVPNDKLIATQAGLRSFIVSIRVESESQDDGEESVGAVASRVRIRLRRPSILAALNAADVALNTLQNTVVADYKSQGRMVSLSVTDVIFSAAENDTQTGVDAGYIETVQVSSQTLDDAGGTPLPEQVELTITGA